MKETLFMVRNSHAAFVLVAAMLAGNAHAQALPATTDSGRTSERVQLPAKPEFSPAVEKKAELKPLPLVPAGQGVVLQDIQLQGATALSSDTLRPLYADALGKPANLAILQTIAERITSAYQAAGYILSKAVVPVQEMRDGKASIVVVEGYVAHIRRDEVVPVGDGLGILTAIEAEILAMRPLHGPSLERSLLLLRDLPGYTITPVIEPLADAGAAPGAVGMVLRIERDRAIHGSASLNNFGSRFGGPWQASVVANASPGLVAFDQVDMAALVSVPWDEVQYVSGGYEVPLNASGTRLRIGGSYAGMEPGYTLEALDIKSRSYDATIGVTHPLLRSRAQNLTLNGLLQWKDISTDILGTELYEDAIRALRLGARYDVSDAWDGANLAVVTVSQGLPVLGASEAGDSSLSRAEGRGNFTKLEAQLSRLQALDAQWSVLGAISGQYASAPLLAAEEFGFGGQSFGRAYDPSEITGDHGLAFSFELQYRPDLPWDDVSLQPYVFYDIGKVWNKDQFQGNASGSSAGLGLRIWHTSGLSGSVAAAFPLTREIENPIYGDGKDPRILFQIGHNF